MSDCACSLMRAEAQPQSKVSVVGKAEPYRTEGGTAADKTSGYFEGVEAVIRVIRRYFYRVLPFLVNQIDK